MIGLNNWAIIAICKHIIANNSLPCARVAVGINKSANSSIVIAALEIIELRVGIIVVPTIP